MLILLIVLNISLLLLGLFPSTQEVDEPISVNQNYIAINQTNNRLFWQYKALDYTFSLNCPYVKYTMLMNDGNETIAITQDNTLYNGYKEVIVIYNKTYLPVNCNTFLDNNGNVLYTVICHYLPTAYDFRTTNGTLAARAIYNDNGNWELYPYETIDLRIIGMYLTQELVLSRSSQGDIDVCDIYMIYSTVTINLIIFILLVLCYCYWKRRRELHTRLLVDTSTWK